MSDLDLLNGLFADIGTGDMKAAAARFSSAGSWQELMLGQSSLSAALAARYPAATAIEVVATSRKNDLTFVEYIERVPGMDSEPLLLRAALVARIIDGKIDVIRHYFDRQDYARMRAEVGIPLDRTRDSAAPADVRPLSASPTDARCDLPGERQARAFFAAWRNLDPEALASWWDEEGILENVPSSSGPPRKGRDAIRNLWQGWQDFMTGVEIEIVAIGAEGDLVFVERIDEVMFRDGSRRTLPCLGVLEFRGTSIRRFTDYFDFGWFANLQKAE